MSQAATLAARAPAGVLSGRERRIQPRVVAGALALLALGAGWLGTQYGVRHAAVFLVGAALGLVLYHAAFGFTAAFRVFVTQRDGRGIRAQMLMLAVATVVFAPVLASGQAFGTDVAGALAPASVSVLVGAFVFAIGMQVGGGCGSGTLFHLGGGTTSMAITLAAFVAGSVLGTFHMPFWWAAPSLGEISLGERLGWTRAVLLQLAACGLIAGATWWLERGRPAAPAGVAGGPPSATGGQPRVAGGPSRATGARVDWWRVIQGPWPLAVGGVSLAALNWLTLVLAGHPWTITWAFALWGAKALEAVGVGLGAVPFWSGGFARAALDAPVLADVTSVMDMGLVLGALLAAGLAGRFAPGRRVPLNRVVASVLGGLLLGYGARIAFGCNIGAYTSGVASTSLHGWLWGAAALAGTPVGVRLRALFGLDAPPSRPPVR